MDPVDTTEKNFIKKNETQVKEFEFLKPSQRPPRRKQTTLTEHVYIKNLHDIVERDFFPNLPELRKRVELLKAAENNDLIKLRNLLRTPAESPLFSNPEKSPATFETPQYTSYDTGSQRSDQSSISSKITENLSLDKFMANYTSEDNESFENVMEEGERKFRLKYAWLFDAEEKHNKHHTPNLSLLSIEEQAQHKNLAITGTCNEKRDVRPKTVENWNYSIFNSVMFVPDGTEMTGSQHAQLAKQKKKEVVHENTRFTENPFSEDLSEATMMEASAVQAYKKEGKVGIDGKDLRDTPRVNGYSYVRDPSPVPGVDASPLMTWGEIEGTPAQLDGSTTPLIRHKATSGPSYKMPKLSNRDELLLKINEKTNQTNRDRKAKALSMAKSRLRTPKGSSSYERMSSISPAARKLLASQRSSSKGLTASLRASYTPSPLSNIGITPSPARTPHLQSPFSKQGPFSPAGITDNLLDLPSKQIGTSSTLNPGRKRAADFF